MLGEVWESVLGYGEGKGRYGEKCRGCGEVCWGCVGKCWGRCEQYVGVWGDVWKNVEGGVGRGVVWKSVGGGVKKLGCGEGKGRYVGRSVGSVGKCVGVWGMCRKMLGEVWGYREVYWGMGKCAKV